MGIFDRKLAYRNKYLKDESSKRTQILINSFVPRIIGTKDSYQFDVSKKNGQINDCKLITNKRKLKLRFIKAAKDKYTASVTCSNGSSIQLQSERAWVRYPQESNSILHIRWIS